MARKEYNCEVVEVITRDGYQVSGKDRIKLKDTSDAIKLDEATKTEPVTIDVVYAAELRVHNENSESVDYSIHTIVDKDGNKFTTGSDSFWDTFVDIMADMAGIDEEWKLKIYRKPSKNHSGKEFITCSIV